MVRKHHFEKMIPLKIGFSLSSESPSQLEKEAPSQLENSTDKANLMADRVVGGGGKALGLRP